EFHVTRTTVNRHIRTLIKQKKLIQSGTTKNVYYMLPDTKVQIFKFTINSQLDEFSIYQEVFSGYLQKLDLELDVILSYAVTEMINNAKDHSQGTKLTIKWLRLA